jgi:hypothetical protein
MTFDRDPDSPMRDRTPTRYNDARWSAIPILVALALVIGIGYVLFAPNSDTTPNRPIGEPTARPSSPPATTAPPLTTPPAGPRQ